MSAPKQVELYDAVQRLFQHYEQQKDSYEFAEVKQLIMAGRMVMKDRYDVAVAAEWCPNDCGKLEWRDGGLGCPKCGLTTSVGRC